MKLNLNKRNIPNLVVGLTAYIVMFIYLPWQAVIACVILMAIARREHEQSFHWK
jgi:hypothetical protein